MQTNEGETQEDIIHAMYEWLHQGKAVFPKLAIEIQQPGRRSVVSTKSIKRGETILYIPKDQIISLETVKNSTVIQNILKNKVKLHSPKHCLLAIYLLEQKADQKSVFKDYIAILPRECNNFPIFYSEQEMKQLKGSPLIEAIEQRKFEIQTDYKTLVQKDIGFKINYDDFCWARMIVCSRIFGIVIGQIKTDALVPLADMLNHTVMKQTVWSYSNEKEGFVIEALQNIPKGVQIYDSYGRKSNSRFLLNYGFVIQPNQSDEIQIKLKIDRKLKTKLMQICQQDPCKFVFKLGIEFDNTYFQELISTVRFVLDVQSSQDFQQQNTNKTTFRQPTDTFTSFQNQLKCWQYIHSIFSQMLQDYPTTIKQDIQLLRSQKPYNTRNCMRLRLGQKKIIQYYIDICKRIEALFASNGKNFKKHWKRKVNKDFQEYLMKINSLVN